MNMVNWFLNSIYLGLSEPEFYADLAYKFKKIMGSTNFSYHFRKVTIHYKCIGYNLNVIRQSACLVINPFTADRASDSMMAQI